MTYHLTYTTPYLKPKTDVLMKAVFILSSLQVFELFYRDCFLQDAYLSTLHSKYSTMLYQVSHRTSLVCQKSHTYEASYVMQTGKCMI